MELVCGNIAESDSDCILNAGSHSSLLGNQGVSQSIVEAGGESFIKLCESISPCKEGECKITLSCGNLKCKHVIHTCGPKYMKNRRNESVLIDCYYNAFNIITVYGYHTISVPLVSSGAYGFPIERVLDSIILAYEKWKNDNPSYDLHVYIYVKSHNVYSKLLPLLS